MRSLAVVKDVLGSALELLGIDPLDQM